jgi:multiple sugar transport system permease protein
MSRSGTGAGAVTPAARPPAARPRGRRITPAGLLDGAVVAIGMIFFASFALFPFVYMVSASFKSLPEILTGFPSIVPRYPTLNNYRYALFGNNLVQTSYPVNVRNSLIIAVMTVAITMAISLPAAFALARCRFWWTTLLSGWVRVAQVVGGIIMIIPLYIVIRDLQLVNTFLGVSLAETIPGAAFATWILASFVAQIPTDLDDAAAIDGAGSLQTLWHVIIPLIRPGIVSVVILVFLLQSWNDFLNPLILLSDPSNYTITIGLNTYVGMSGQTTQWGQLMCVCVLSCIIPALLIIFADRHIIRGLASGAIKE